MANQIIVKYLADTSIPREKREAVMKGLNSGDLPESAAIQGITSKYGNKYGAVEQPTSGASKLGAAIGALNPKNAGNMVAKAASGVDFGGAIKSLAEKGRSTTEADIASYKQQEQQGDAARQRDIEVSKQLASNIGELPENATPEQREALLGEVQRQIAGNIMPGGGVGVGVGKGAMNTVMGASQLAAKGMSALTKSVTGGKVGMTPEAEANMQSAKEAITTPKGLSESIGYGGEQIAEFLVPAGVIGKGTKAVEAVTAASKLPSAVKTGLNLVSRMGLEGLAGGGVAALQAGDINKDVAATAAVSAAMPAISTVIGKAINAAKGGRMKAASAEIAKIIKPDKNAYLFGKDPALAVAKEGIVANNMDDLVKNISSRADDIGKQVEANIASTGAKKVVTGIEDIIQKNADDFGTKVTDKNAWKAYSDKLSQLTGDFKPDLKTGELIKVADKDLSKMTTKELWDLQKKVGKLAQWTGAVGENEANKQLHKLYSTLGEQLEKAAPGTKELRFRWGELLGAEKAARARAAVAARNTNALTNVVSAGVGGSIYGGMTGKSGIDNLLGAAGGVALNKIIQSPALRTRLAGLLAKESSMNKTAVSKVLTALAKYGTSKL